MGFLSRLFAARSASHGAARELHRVALTWRDDVSLPVPDWKAAQRSAATREGAHTREAFWWNAAWTWLDALRERLGAGY